MPIFLLNVLGFFSPKTWGWIILLVAIGGGVLYARGHWINLGRTEALADINAANAKAQGNANQGVKSVSDCYDGGGTWDRANGVCLSTSTGK